MSSLRHALRSLAGTPAATLLTLITLALGIGVATATFSIIEALLLRPLPYADSDRLVMIWEHHRERAKGSHGPGRNVVSPANFVQWRERSSSFEAMTMVAGGQGTMSVPFSMTVTGAVPPQRLGGALVSDTFFSTLGVAAVRGRVMQRGDGVPGAPPVVVLSSGFWRRALAEDPSAVGRMLVINGTATQIVGIVADDITLPLGAELWVPVTDDERLAQARGRWTGAIGRLRPGVSTAQAQAELDGIMDDTARQEPRNVGWSTHVRPLREDLVAGIRPALRIAVLAAFCVLAIGCLNAVNLLLARALARQRDLSIRMALGASGRRLILPLLAESLVLGAAAGLLGLGLAALIIDGQEQALQALLSTGAPITLNLRVLLFAAAVALICSVTCGVLPALLAVRRVSPGHLRDGRTISAGRAVTRARSALVLTEIALALGMLITAGLLVRSFARLTQVDPGFDVAQVVTLRAAPTGPSYEAEGAGLAYFERMRTELGRLPGVRAAGAISWRPFGGGAATTYRVVGETVLAPGQEPVADVRIITPDLFEALGVPLRSGRTFGIRDDAKAPQVAIVNEAFAVALSGDNNLTLGREILMVWGTNEAPIRVVGVVGDVRLTALDTPARPTVYLPLTQSPSGVMTMAVRVDGDPRTAIAAIRQSAAQIDAGVPVTDVETMETIVDASIGRPRVLLLVLTGAAFVALVLALIGLYGILTHEVRQRSREIGVRMAVGASPRQVIELVLRDGARLLAIGCAAGLLLGLLAGYALEGQLFEIGRLDVVTYVLVATLFVLVGLGATALPAWRASRVDPVHVLRQE